MVYWCQYGSPESNETLRRYLETRPNEVDTMAGLKGAYSGISGAVSPDGIHWKPLPDPMVITLADTPNVCYYDTQLRKYVLYTRC